MTIVEKAAYLKGLVEGMDIDPNSKDGKIWNGILDLLSDMAHEIEDLEAASDDFADALDEVCDELNYLEELCCDLDDECKCCCDCDDDDDDDDEDDEELEYDGIVYDVTCPVCGEEISFDEDVLAKGSIRCPSCDEKLEFDFGNGEEDED